MSVLAPVAPLARPALGILFILVGMAAITVNDVLVKYLSGGYPLHEIVFIRSAVGICFSLFILQFEGGFSSLRTAHPWLHATRGLLIVLSNLTYFSALAVLSLAEASALFYVAPLMITLLSIPLLGERVGPFRLGAVAVGFLGVLVMLRPWQGGSAEVDRWILVLPVVAALTYALNTILTRRLGVTSRASAMAVYIQFTFILVSLGFWLVAGDGRYAAGVDNPSLLFLLRAWVWPEGSDRLVLLGLGVNAAVIGYCLSQAYRLGNAATIAPFEYAGLPLAVLAGWMVWHELPDAAVWTGIVMILGAGLVTFLRERQRGRRSVVAKPVNRRY